MLKNGIDYFNEVLILTIPGREYFNNETNEFFEIPETTIRLKHSLLSISKWEAKHERPFLDVRKPLTYDETVDYIRFMTLTQNVNPIIYQMLSKKHMKLVNQYISANMTGTTFGGDNNGPKRSMRNPMSAEVIYYYMSEFNIPWECQKWHLNRLLTLIRVCGIKKTPPKKSKGTAKSRQQLNAARRRKTGSRG